MTFAIDRTRSFLKVEESNLLSLHRSTHPIVPAEDLCQGHPCDAFICVVHEYNLHRVYVALHDQQLKSNLVFIADPIRPDNKKLEVLLLKAHEFLENIGFKMEPVNLSFSSATREVIIRDIRVMREPSLPLQLDAAKMALEGLVAENKEISRKASQEQAVLKTEVENLRERLIAATAVQQAAAVQPPAGRENSIVDEEGEGAGLRLVGAEQELQQLQEELGSVKAMLKSARDEARQARKELKLSRHEGALLSEKLKSGQLELDKARDEINRLMAELAGKDLVDTGEIEVLRAALADANVFLAFEKAKNESALQEMDALERNASAELKLLKKKVDTLTTEKLLLEKTTAEIKIKAYGEIERQQQVNQLQRKAAIKKLHALKEEIRQLAEARAVIASPTGHSLVQPGNNSSNPVNDREESFVASQQAGFSFGLFGSSEAPEYLNFFPNNLLKGVPYSCSDEVVEIYRSYNTIHAAPTGKQAEKCDGFVCLVTEGDRSLVYVAWQMNSSGETLVCLPERAADGEESCRRLLGAGIGYFERIGFLIDRLPLENEPDKRQAQLDRLAIFCRTVSDCAA